MKRIIIIISSSSSRKCVSAASNIYKDTDILTRIILR
jgi:hypothetical protein